MPEPVFRSSPGRAPKNVDVHDPEKEIPTEPGFVEPTDSTTIRAAKHKNSHPAQKKRGCRRTFAAVVGVIATIVVAVIIALVYFLYLLSAGCRSWNL